MNKNVFSSGTKKLTTKRKYYHGSATQIHGDFLQPREQFNSVQNKRVTGAFVTYHAEYAKFFALVKCLSGRGQINTIIDKKTGNKKIFFERLAKNIKPEFYLYTVYEPTDAPFIHDRGTEYYSTEPIKISGRKTYNTFAELRKMGYKIYELNEPLKNKRGTSTNDNLQSEMRQAISDGKYHRVDIADLIKQQPPRNAFQRLFNKQND